MKRISSSSILLWAQTVGRSMVKTRLLSTSVNAKNYPASVRICRIELSIENGVSSTQKVEYAFVQTMLRSVEDLKFADDTELMVAGFGECKIQR